MKNVSDNDKIILKSVVINLAYDDVPKVVRDYLFYLDVVTGKSKNTVYEYYTDLKYFLKFIKAHRLGLTSKIQDTDISDLDAEFLKQITLQDIYEYLYHMKEVRGCQSRTLNRKSSSIRGFFKYHCNKTGLLSENPTENLESSAIPRTLPKYLSLDESKELLSSALSGNNSKRDYAILTLFLNCGMRLNELVSINLSDLGDEYLTINGKGNKQRSIYMNSACRDAIEDYIKNERKIENLTDDGRCALFVSRNGNRIARRRVQQIVEEHLKKSGLSDKSYSTHKLRHTAATLMYRYGNTDVRILQEILGHENLGTTQIYTHVDSEQIKHAIASNPIAKAKKDSKEK